MLLESKFPVSIKIEIFGKNTSISRENNTYFLEHFIELQNIINNTIIERQERKKNEERNRERKKSWTDPMNQKKMEGF